MDRGGLLYIRETTFHVFLALEDGVRRFLAADLSGHGMCREKVIDFVLLCSRFSAYATANPAAKVSSRYLSSEMYDCCCGQWRF